MTNPAPNAVGAGGIAGPDVAEVVLDAALDGLGVGDELKVHDLVLVEAGEQVGDAVGQEHGQLGLDWPLEEHDLAVRSVFHQSFNEVRNLSMKKRILLEILSNL